ncbi:ABC transporter ATP-binding protein [Vibrio ponticus]|uniref:Quaternary amine transport ATP-binding protein n=1 Tax=Vibrio ponticus TaxID=265668 RepID=A0A3N3E2Q2_9VIBR|nr:MULTISPECIES: ABC transporter ATP-binding protein [Vibrio]OLQ87668.1 ABC transporter ATP-binding protein [Vibrio ponticus]ROV61003.1 ATP-binding cassette domain-containing protein [Vibrio ponticus]
MIQLDNLTKIFETPQGVITAADRISMEVPTGEICVLLGPSGCGKTTTLKMINRLVTPTSGRVLINGEDTTDIDTVTLRRNIGYVIQQTGLFPNMTIEENISLVPKLMGWDVQRCKQRAKDLLDMVALDPNTFMKRYPNELSGGQQQRVGVIRALAADAPVLLMDEPFGAIDPINRDAIQEEFLKMNRELNKTIMFVSHDIDEAVKMADKIAIFRDGKLEQFSSPDRLLAKPETDFVADFVGNDRTLKRLQLATAADVMETHVPVVTAGETLQQAAKKMEEYGHGMIVKVNKQHQPVGIITREMSLSYRGLCGEHYAGIQLVIQQDEDLRAVVSKMFAYDLSWLPVVDAQGRLCGEVSQRGITHHLGAKYQTKG